MAILNTRDLTLAYEERVVISRLNLTIPQGKITALVGGNGCGKSTLLRSLARLLKPRSGVVYLDSKAIHSLPTRAVATQLGILPQGLVAPEGLTVRDLVAQGRYPHQGWFQQANAEDERAVEQAMVATGISDLADRTLEALSGGQRQRAWMAMTLAQGTEILLLDEPTTYLDIAHQIDVLELLLDLNQNAGRTIVMVLHDLNQAARYAHHLVAIKDGQIHAEGDPAVVVTPDMVREVFGLECCVVPDPVAGSPMCVPYSRRSKAGSDSPREYRCYNLHAPDEVRQFTVPAPGVRRWDQEAIVYDVRIGDGLLRHYGFPNRWFEVNCTLDLAGRFVTESGPVDWCFNCDIATPVQVVGRDAYNLDLCLDLLVGPDGRTHALIDEDDFARAIDQGWFSPAEQAGAREGLADLLAIIRTQGLVSFLDAIHPFGAVADCGVQPPPERLPLAAVPMLARLRPAK